MVAVAALMAACVAIRAAVSPSSVATVHISPVAVSRGGVDTLVRTQFFNIHSAPTTSDWDVDEAEQFAGYGAGLGRTFAVSGRMSTIPPSPTGVLNVSELKAACSQRPEPSGWPTASVEMITSSKLDVYFPAQDPKGYVATTPAAAATMWSEYLRYCAPPQARQICEIMNEPNVHVKDCNTTWEYMVTVHAAIAQRLHADYGRNGSVVVGGPTEAFPEYEAGNFTHFNSFLKTFIDTAGHDVDFLSVHLYDTCGPSIKTDPTNISHRTGNNVDAILDLAEAYSLATVGRRLPHLISEFGTGFKVDPVVYEPVNDWHIIAGVQGKMLQFLHRPDAIVKTVPFISSKSTWHSQTSPYPYQLFHEAPNGSWAPTHLAKFYRFWAGVDGRYLAANTSNTNVQVVAFDDIATCTTHLVVNSLLPTPATVGLSSTLLTGASAANVTRLYLAGDTPALTTNVGVTVPASLQLAPFETRRLSMARGEASQCAPLPTIVESTTYAPNTVVPIDGGAQTFEVPAAVAVEGRRRSAEPSPHAYAALRLSYSVPAARLNEAPQVAVNGVAVPVDLSVHMAGYPHIDPKSDVFWGSVCVPVPASVATAVGPITVTVAFPASGGFVSSVGLVSAA